MAIDILYTLKFPACNHSTIQHLFGNYTWDAVESAGEGKSV